MKKSIAKRFYVQRELKSKKLLRIMKLSVLFLSACMLHLYAGNTYSQSAIVSIGENSLTLQELITEIENQTDYLFVYSRNDISAEQKVKVKTGENSVASVLDNALSDTEMTYVFANNYISLRKKSEKKAIGKEEITEALPPSETVVARAKVPNSLPIPAQTRRIQGTVVDARGEAIIGANVVEKGTTNGSVTDIDGKFTLDVSNNAVLQVTYIGYLPREMAVAGRTVFSITLDEDVKTIDEVVVVGYGVQRKVTATGAVSKVEGEEISKISTVNASKALQGITPGITIIDRGGAPGSDDPDIYLRGVGTTGTSSPLVLVDGMEMSLSQIPSQEIESISVLKDAASASIYGSRAAHGVILVTTKRGKTGKAKITYNGTIGFQDLAIRPEQISAREYLDMVNESSFNAGGTAIYSDEVIAKILNGTDPYNYTYMNYVDEVYKKAYITEHTVNINGGNENARYLAMFNYLDQPGMIDNTEYKRYNYRMNVDLNINKYLRLSSDLSYRHSDRLWPTALGSAQSTAFSMVPTVPVRYADGRYTLDDQQNNPVAYTDLDVTGKDTYQRDNFAGQVKAELEPIKDLIFTGVVALDGIWDRRKVHSRNYKFYDANGDYLTQKNASNGVYDLRNNSYQLTLRFLANYTKTFVEQHSVSLLYGMERLSYRNYRSQAERQNLVSDELPDVSLGSASNQYAYGYPTSWGINSFFGRINYGFRDKYLFEANLRADGSSKFAKGHKWGVFPSVSGAWRLSEESFLKEYGFFDNLKLRASWGQTGNERIPTSIGQFLYLPQYGTGTVVMDGSLVTSVQQTRMANPEITWETVEQTDIGLDFAFLGNSLFGEFDFYIKDTKDILLDLAIPKYIGLDAPYQNAGVVRNQGYEVMLGYRKMDGDFKFSVSANFDYKKNEWRDRAGDDDNIHDSYYIERSGYELRSFYVYKADGLIANDQELAEYKAKHTSDPRGISVLKAGDVKLVDTNGDGTIDPDDRQVFSSNVPKFSYGLNLTAQYKNFDMSLLFQGTAGANRFFYGEFYEGPSYEAFTGIHFRKRWTEQNQDGNAEVPRLEAANNRNQSTYNSYFLRNISYLRLKNAQIGYTLPKDLTQKVMIENVRVYLSGSNLFTISGLHQGLDPEQTSGRLGNFPPLKIFQFGVNVTF